MADLHYAQDSKDFLDNAEIIHIDWPPEIKKPLFAVIKDYCKYPRWTKNIRFLENNGFNYEIFDLHAHDWVDKAKKFDIFVGIVSNQLYHLNEMRSKYHLLETYLAKTCFPSFQHIFLYENKTLEAYISEACGLPYAKTYVSNNKDDALRVINSVDFPLVNKPDHGSGSMGIELVKDKAQAKDIVNKVFSFSGKATHSLYHRQKNHIYFQEFIPNDGHDIRVILIGNWAFGYFRKVLAGDFRASGMNQVIMRDLPIEAIQLAYKVNKIIKSPMLVVDMVHGLDGKYTIIEFSPICQIEKPTQLRINDITGVYIIDDDGSIRFMEGKFWLHELALREFLLNTYLPVVRQQGML